jgi:hypothetical protein
MANIETEPHRSISELLQETLRTKSISVEKLSLLTGISDRFIANLLDGERKRLPAAPYLHGYILKIAEVIGVDGESLWKEYQRETQGIRRSGKDDVLPQNRFETSRLSKRAIGIAAAVLIVIVYLAIRLPSILGTPALTITAPVDMQVVTTSTLSISGTMDPADELTINGSPVYPEKNGAFVRNVTLEPGFTNFEFRATRFLGRENVISRQVFYRVTTSTIITPITNGFDQESF